VRFDHGVVRFLWPGAMATEALADNRVGGGGGGIPSLFRLISLGDSIRDETPVRFDRPSVTLLLSLCVSFHRYNFRW
jgi:hypothetical protein